MAVRKYLWMFSVVMLLIAILSIMKMSSDPPPIGRHAEISNTPKESQKVSVGMSQEALESPLSVDQIQPSADQGIHDDFQSDENDTDLQSNAEHFYGAVFPAMMQDSAGSFAHEAYAEAKSGHVIEMEDFFKKRPPSKIIPHISGGKVLAISVFRKFNGKTYEPGSMLNVSEKGWETFPPISRMEAETLLMEKMPNSYLLRPGLVHVMDDVTPNYQFFIPGEEAITYLVDAFSGHVDMIPTDYPAPESKEEDPPIYFDENGLLLIDQKKVESWSPERLRKLKADVEKSNADIQAGLLKIGPNFEVIFDKRPRRPIIRHDSG